VITDIRILILKKKTLIGSYKKKIKKDVKITDLKGVTKSTLKNANVIIFHIKNQHDEMLFTEKYEEIINTLK